MVGLKFIPTVEAADEFNPWFGLSAFFHLLIVGWACLILFGCSLAGANPSTFDAKDADARRTGTSLVKLKQCIILELEIPILALQINFFQTLDAQRKLDGTLCASSRRVDVPLNREQCEDSAL